MKKENENYYIFILCKNENVKLSWMLNYKLISAAYTKVCFGLYSTKKLRDYNYELFVEVNKEPGTMILKTDEFKIGVK